MKLYFAYYGYGTNEDPWKYIGYDASINYNKEYCGQHYARGQEYYTEYYDKKHLRVKTESRQFNNQETGKIFGMEIMAGYNQYGNDYDLNIYYYPIGSSFLEKETTTITNLKPVISTETTYTYNKWNLINSVKTKDSKDREIVITTRFPTDLNTGIYAEMADKRMINYPIEEITSKGNVTLSILNTYKKENSSFHIDNIYSLSKNGSLIPFDGVSYDADYRQEAHFSSYDEKENVIEVLTKDGTPITYLWSYNHQYPIAEIKNASYEQVKNSIVGGEDYIKNLSVSYNPSMDRISQLRNLLPQTLISTFTYKPLFGTTSATDARGISNFYNYDIAGRLKEIFRRNNLGVKQTINLYDYYYRDNSL